MRVYLSLILCICWYAVSSQSILDENNRWNYVCCYGGPSSSTSIIKIGSDTLINDIMYKQILGARDSTLNEWNISSTFMREDSLGRIYTRETFSDNGEILMYDFNMQLGDTLYLEPSCSYTLDTIDTIILQNGQTRKRMVFNVAVHWNTRAASPIVWIEGIGSINDAFWDYRQFHCSTDNDYSLRCYFYNEELTYREFPWACFYTNTHEEQIEIALMLYPNPADETLYLNFEESVSIQNINIFSIDGKFKETFNASQEIEVGHMTSGIYYLVIQTDEGWTRRKFLKL